MMDGPKMQRTNVRTKNEDWYWYVLPEPRMDPTPEIFFGHCMSKNWVLLWCSQGCQIEFKRVQWVSSQNSNDYSKTKSAHNPITPAMHVSVVRSQWRFERGRLQKNKKPELRAGTSLQPIKTCFFHKSEVRQVRLRFIKFVRSSSEVRQKFVRSHFLTTKYISCLATQNQKKMFCPPKSRK